MHFRVLSMLAQRSHRIVRLGLLYLILDLLVLTLDIANIVFLVDSIQRARAFLIKEREGVEIGRLLQRISARHLPVLFNYGTYAAIQFHVLRHKLFLPIFNR